LLSDALTPDPTKIRYEHLELTPADASRAMRAANQTMRDVVAEKHAQLLDLGGQLTQPDLLEDHVHFSTAGSAAVGLAFADFLEPILAARAASAK
jgi:lysophospholipase L1-like esterase